ncbi:hypothetical protein WJX74_009518 [Apatococcus lobatus]|uniref:MaoC-like domain-containing protein n=2 Tax=Apatococcus TaxID=904362 RepID=A0AAW1T981_9CHLO
MDRLQEALQGRTTTDFQYTERDCILYALSLGVSAQNLSLVYEGFETFQPFPTLGVLTGFVHGARPALDSLLPNFNPANLLHGEHTLHVHKPLPRAAKLTTTARLVHIADKGRAAIAVMELVSSDASTGSVICTNEFTNFVRGAGGFGGSVSSSDYHPPPTFKVPTSQPDKVQHQPTTLEQAALYRLNGDRNPLHIDPAVSQQVGFEHPILHGLCTFGIAARHVAEFADSKGCGALQSVKVRFANVVVPGDELHIEMWHIQDGRFAFQVRNATRGTLAITNGHATFSSDVRSRL